MLYGLVDKHIECLEILNSVDIIGSDYRHHASDQNPDHFSGNFWWANSDYINTLSVYHLKDKYDAEFWLFRNQPTFFHINKCPYGHYENTYKTHQYAHIIDDRMASMIQTLEDLKKCKKVHILYGIDGQYLDVTDKCLSVLIKDGMICIPGGDMLRNELFTDPLPGVIKHIRIGNVKYPYTENIRLPITLDV